MIDKQNRSEILYEWIAKYEDGTELRQFDDEKNIEYHFGHIKQDKLIEFILVNKYNPKKTLSINLETGLYSIDGEVVEVLNINNNNVNIGMNIVGKNIESKTGNRVALIYFRRIQRTACLTNPSIVSSKLIGIWYFLGWESKIDGVYHKYEIAIDCNGEIIIPPKSNFSPL